MSVQTDPILKPVSDVVAEAMGKSTGEDFYKLYEFEDKVEIIIGAGNLLRELIGPEMVEKKLANMGGKS